MRLRAVRGANADEAASVVDETGHEVASQGHEPVALGGHRQAAGGAQAAGGPRAVELLGVLAQREVDHPCVDPQGAIEGDASHLRPRTVAAQEQPRWLARVVAGEVEALAEASLPDAERVRDGHVLTLPQASGQPGKATGGAASVVAAMW